MTGTGEKKILCAFEYLCADHGRPVSFERSVLLLTSEDAGRHIGYLTHQWGNILNRRSNNLFLMCMTFHSHISLPFSFHSSFFPHLAKLLQVVIMARRKEKVSNMAETSTCHFFAGLHTVQAVNVSFIERSDISCGHYGCVTFCKEK